MIKIFFPYSEGAGGNWAGLLDDSIQHVSKQAEADIVILTGGVDINPEIYGESRAENTQRPHPKRDARDINAVRVAIANKQPILGICRGSQMLCALAGGRLVQDQPNRVSVHSVFIKGSDEKMVVTSEHHQAQFPWQIPKDCWELLTWTKGLHSHHLDAYGDEMFHTGGPNPDKLEVEDVYYRLQNSLAIQSHPEWIYEGSRFDPSNINYFNSLNYHKGLVKKLLNKQF